MNITYAGMHRARMYQVKLTIGIGDIPVIQITKLKTGEDGGDQVFDEISRALRAIRWDTPRI
jgi:hypothetical protein